MSVATPVHPHYAAGIESPPVFTSFVGRRSLLAEVAQRLARHRAVTLTGPGGVGKTRTALAVVESERRGYPGGCWYVDLSTVPGPALVAATVAGAMGLHTDAAAPTPEGLVDFVADFVAERRALLVLDGCEPVLDATVAVLVRLGARCPGLRVLATSRQRLGLSGEAVVTVPPLTCPTPLDGATPEGLPHFEAVELFVDRASLVSSDFRLTATNAEAVAELCTRLEGNPLALELAAARAAQLTPRTMVDQLDDRFRFLSQGPRDVPARHRSLRACIEWSFDLCTGPEQLLWQRMSIFAGGSQLDAATEVCVDGEVGRPDVVELVGALVDKSVLVAADAGDGSTRFLMLDSLAEFGRERLRAADEFDRWRERHLDWCSLMASRFRADWAGAHQAALLRRVRAEHANLGAALEFCATGSVRPEATLQIASDLEPYWVTAGRADEARHWLQVGLATDGGKPAERAHAMGLVARFAGLQHDLGTARDWAARAAEQAEAADDDATRGVVLTLTATLAARDGDLDLAVDSSARAVALQHARGSVIGEVRALFVHGLSQRLSGDRVAATEAYTRAIRLSDASGDTFWKSFSLAGLGEVSLDGGSADRAEELFVEALALKVELGDRLGIALALDALGRAALADDRARRGAVLLGAAEAIWEAIGMRATGNPFVGRTSRSEALDRARAALGSNVFRSELRRGSALSETQAVAYALGEPLGQGAAASDEPSPLTRREAEVAGLVAEGLSNPEIAERLVISVRTAQGHVENILRKLGFTSRAMIAAWVAHRQAVARAGGAAGGPPGPPGPDGRD